MRLFDIKRFAIHDGPGIRTTLFMKGCPLHCVWCHNPEGISYEPTRLFTASKCIHCGAHETEGVEGCPTLALQEAGKDWTLEDILRTVEKERLVMEESGGGVTLCGGEPLMHPDALLEVLQALGERGFHRTVDTTLCAPWSVVERVMPHAELFMVDIKHMDSVLHKEYTGVGNDLILDNIRSFAAVNGRPQLWLRIPLIDGVNADDVNLEATAAFIASLPSRPEQVNLLPYHDVGKAKHARMGSLYNPKNYTMNVPSEELLAHAGDVFNHYGITTIIGG
jgi:pyruvate formate lyase activating enzyme